MGAATVLVDGLTATAGCRFDPVEERAYVVEIGGRLLSVGADRERVVHTRDLRGATDVALSDDGRTAFVSTRDGGLSALDLATPGAVPEPITTGLGALAHIAFVPARGTVWVVQAGPQGRLLEVDPATGATTDLSDVLDGGVGLAVRADASEAFVSRPGGIVLVDVAGGGSVTPFASAGDEPGPLAWSDPGESMLLHAEPGAASRIVQIDPAGTASPLLETGDVHPAGLGTAWDQVLVSGLREVILYDPVPAPPGPQVTGLSPARGYGGDVLVLTGSGFGDWATPVDVEVGGVPATVLEHADNRLRVLTAPETQDGSVLVTVGPDTVDAGAFTIDDAPGYFDDGPPLVLSGPAPSASPGDQGLPKKGGSVFVALVTPADLAAPAASARTTIDDRWNGGGPSVSTYYDQASFGRAAVSGTVPSGWRTLSGNLLDYHWTSELTQKTDGSGNPVFDAKGHAVYETDAAGNPVPKKNADGTVKTYDNFWNVQRLAAEAVNLYRSEIDAAAPDMIAVTCFTNGAFARAVGNLSATTFAYSPAGLGISETLGKDTAYIAVNEAADWGRLAHETGHDIIDPKFVPGALLGEDVYASDLVDPSEATAAAFDMMGSHDGFHALFSGSNLENLGWLTDVHASQPNDENLAGQTNIGRVKWDRNPRSFEVELQAHGTTENTVQGRYHVLKIIVTPSLAYYVEVRQRPGATGLVFDPLLPDGGAPNQGGVVVTRVLLDSVNNNQQTRFITLAHGPTVLRSGGTAVDPLRDLTIRVVDDAVQAWPLICKVAVEWAQNVPNDPAGKFDLRIENWDDHYQTPDVWVDRKQDGLYDQPKDAEGRPLGSGDKPLVLAKNDLWCRVHNDGSDAASDVQLTFYSTTPPGVGDNGSWAPMKTVPIAAVPAGGFFDASTIWVPQVGEHTCLQVVASHQLGEVTGGNNLAQENVTEFDLSGSSPAHPLTMPIAVRNPSPERQRIHLRPDVTGRTRGYVVQIPHQWVWVDGLGERRIDVVVAAPESIGRYVEAPPVDVRISGFLERRYDEPSEDGTAPAEFRSPIGGITARCKAKPGCRIRLEAAVARRRLRYGGVVSPGGSGIPVLIVLAGGPEGDVVADEVQTGAGGGFSASVGLRKLLDRNPELQGSDLDVVAVVDRAPSTAGGRSNRVRIRP